MSVNILLLAIGSLVLIYQVINGWRMGVAREVVSFIAIIVAYAVGWWGGRALGPLLRPLGYPDIVLNTGAGAVLGLITLLVIRGIGAVLFKRTSQQSLGLIKFLYGMGGALLGLIFGVVLIWASVIGLRFLGALASLELKSIPHEQAAKSPWISGLAEVKKTLDDGPAGPVAKQIDPIPTKVYEILGKTVRLLDSPEATHRFLSYPGALPLTRNPKIVALQNDREISEQLQKHDLLPLLRNERVVEAANDPEVSALIKNFELEKALDFALKQQPTRHAE